MMGFNNEKESEQSVFFDAVKKAVYICMLSGSLFFGQGVQAQEKEVGNNASVKKEHVDEKKHLREGENVVSQEVMNVFARIVDPMSEYSEVQGGYLKKNFLDSPEKIRMFREGLANLGYTSDQIDSAEKNFAKDNIVFSKTALERKDFHTIMGHERLHKAIEHCSFDEKKILNDARDEIIRDYKEKEMVWSDEVFIFTKAHPDMLPSEMGEKSKEIIQKHNPILLDKNGGVEGILPIIMNAGEFYTYLYMGKLSPQVEEHLKNTYPDAYALYISLVQSIEADTL